MEHPRCIFRFADVEVDESTFSVTKAGEVLPLEPKVFKILQFLVHHPGRVVTKDELLDAVWSDTSVSESSLTRSVATLRRLLGDDIREPRYIATVPTVGYRFLCEVQVSENGLAPAGSPDAITEPPPKASIPPEETLRPRKSSRLAILAACSACVVGLAAVVIYRWHRQHGPQEQAALTAVPFTALPGEETAPAFSPDGSRIAFAWNGDPAPGTKGFDLYVKAIGSETLLRLTRHPSEWISPAWSPDGTQIAFHRTSGPDTGLYVVPALGGPEKRLRSTRVSSEDYPMVSWSPDGRSIAFSDWLPSDDHTGIYLLSTATGDAERIPKTSKCLGQVQPAFSHSGDHLAYWCVNGKESVLYSLPLEGGQPKMISLFEEWPTGLTWSADDKELIYTLWHGFSFSSGQFAEVSVANGSIKTLAFAVYARLPAVSARGDKLAFSSYSSRLNIWRRDLAHPESPPVELVPSSRAQWDAEYSPDEKRIAFASNRSGRQGVWISSDDGSDPVQVSNPNYASGSPQWSPDGSRIAFNSLPYDRWEIYIADMAERKPRKLITNISGVIQPHWSRDGKWIYFRSEEAGRTGVYRCPASGGDAVALSNDIDGISPQESFDGKTVYFASHADNSTLKKAVLSGQPGTESEVDGLPRVSFYNRWTVSPTGIYFVPAEAPRSLRYFDFATRQIRPIFDVGNDFSGGLSVSPDGRWILYSQESDVNSDIMLVDHIR